MVEWRRIPIERCRNYEASSGGAIRRGSRELVGYVDRYGYRTVLLSYAGLKQRFKVHRLVCEAFHGPCPEGRECAHLDGDATNNSATNLAWVTRSENQRHQVQHGTYRNPGKSGEAHHASKLTSEKVVEYRKRHAEGESGRKLALEAGITSANMSKILRGDQWKGVTK